MDFDSSKPSRSSAPRVVSARGKKRFPHPASHLITDSSLEREWSPIIDRSRRQVSLTAPGKPFRSTSQDSQVPQGSSPPAEMEHILAARLL